MTFPDKSITFGGGVVVNLLHLCEMMWLRWHSEDELNVPIEMLRKFAEKNYFELRQRLVKDKTKYKLVRKEIPVHFISDETKETFKFLDLADIHIGNRWFEEDTLRDILKQAVENEIEAVFIAGDIFDGVTVECECLKEHTTQIEKAYQIFKDYPLKYYAINGNHDYTFEQIGMCNPVKVLATKLNEIGIEFHHFDTYVMDFVLCGVVKRVMHVERQDFTKKRIFAVEKLRQFEKTLGLVAMYDGKEYPVRFFQAGHIHVNVQMYYQRRKIFISQSGSFLTKDGNDEKANFITGNVIDKKVFMC